MNALSMLLSRLYPLSRYYPDALMIDYQKSAVRRGMWHEAGASRIQIISMDGSTTVIDLREGEKAYVWIEEENQ